MAIYLTSDLHLNHDKDFVWQKRGYNNVEEMNEAIITAINSRIASDKDDLYILGDICLGKDAEAAASYLRRLKGNIHIVWGNHDSDTKKEAYSHISSIVEDENSIYLKYGKYRFYLSHYPTITGSEFDIRKPLKQQLINIHGHTHQTYCFNSDYPLMFHVGIDTSIVPFCIDEIIKFMEENKWLIH